MNLVRTKPQDYSRLVSAYSELFRGNVIYLPERMPTILSEGPNLIDETTKFLKSFPSGHPFTRYNALDLAAKSQLADLIVDPTLGHFGKDGSGLQARLKKFGTLSGKAAENIVRGDPTARQAAISMLLDNGVPTRQHRKNITDPDFNLVGIGCGYLETGKPICLIIFAKAFAPVTTKVSKPARLTPDARN